MRNTLNKWGAEKKPFVFLIDFECTKPMAWLVNECPEMFKYNFQGITNSNNNLVSKKKFEFEKNPISFELYETKLKQIKKEIELGNSFLVNLTVQTPTQSNFSLEEIFEQSKSKYKILLQGNFVCFSPETFVKINNGIIYSFPMKGTIDATIENAKELILNDQKEEAEHATIVDLIRNDLSIIAKNVTVNRYRYYEEIQTQHGLIGQVSSEIAASLPTDYNERIGDLIFHLLPAGSVSGAPKKKTLEIIHDVESAKRDYYTGVAGYFDGQNLDSCVLIRFLQNDGIYRSGGGITFQSNLNAEYQEMINKIYVPIY